MTPEAIEFIERSAKLVAMASPVVLLLFRGVRRWIGAQWDSLTEPVRKRMNANDAALKSMAVELRAMRLATDARLETIQSQVGVIAGLARMQQDNDAAVGYFQCDEEGRNVWVSSTYADWMNADVRDLGGWGFLAYTHPEDRERVQREWDRCRRQHTDYRERVKMGPMSGPYVEYEIVCRPIPEAPPARAWAGTIKPMVHRGRRSTDPSVVRNGPRVATGD